MLRREISWVICHLNMQIDGDRIADSRETRSLVVNASSARLLSYRICRMFLN